MSNGIFSSEHGTALGTLSITDKQAECNTKCSKYPFMSPDYNGCLLGCFDSTYLPFPGTVPTLKSGELIPTWGLPGMTATGSQVPPGWTQPGPPVQGWALPPLATVEQVACNNECNKSYPLLSPEWINCNSACFGIPVPTQIIPQLPPSVTPYTPPADRPPPMQVKMPDEDKGSLLKSSALPIAAGLAVLGIGAFILFGKKKKPQPSYMLRNASRSVSELKEMRDLLKLHGYDPKDAAKLQKEGMGVFELETRLKERGGLVRTHGFKVSKNGKHYPKAYDEYGSSMGRREYSDHGSEKVRLERVPLDRGGYDPGGAYWGIGAPLYVAYNDSFEQYVRAYSRDEAKKKISKDYPGVKFYR